jgi:hypothetical protein
MDIKIRQIGGSMGRPAQFIELTVYENGSQIASTVTNLKGIVDTELIYALRQIADDLEEQNTKVSEFEKDYKKSLTH